LFCLEGGLHQRGMLKCKVFDGNWSQLWGLVGRRRKPKTLTKSLGFQSTTPQTKYTFLVGERAKKNCVERGKKNFP